MIEKGKRDLVAILARDAENHPDDPVPLYDFSLYSTITTEALPPPGSDVEMKFYWDSSHFKDNVGDMVLYYLLRPTLSEGLPADFGVLLTAETIEAVLESQRREQKNYRHRHREEISLIADWIRAFREEHNIPE